MDALKKAELAKRRTRSDNTPPSTSAEPPAAATTGVAPSQKAPGSAASVIPPLSIGGITSRPGTRTSSLPPLEHLELLDDEFVSKQGTDTGQAQMAPEQMASSTGDTFSLQDFDVPANTQTAKTAGATESPPDREAVQNLFDTKQPAASHKTFAIVIGLATLIAAVGIGAYFWYQLQPKSGLQASAGLNLNVPPPAPAIPIASTPPSTAPSDPIIPALSPPSDSAVINDTEPPREVATAQAAKLSAVPVKKLFQLTTAAASRPDPALERGYDALKRDDVAASRAAYEQALSNDPHNIDALSGLAALAQRVGNADQAAEYYLRILEADPHSALALAGLINLQPQMNPAEAETRLKQALATQPDSAALNFSLGNVYAHSKRWSEAQQVYFKAMTADPGNPDYLFNLAISLDQLRQPKLAATYYAQAIAATDNRPGGFDKTKASERLQQLQQ